MAAQKRRLDRREAELSARSVGAGLPAMSPTAAGEESLLTFITSHHA